MYFRGIWIAPADESLNELVELIQALLNEKKRRVCRELKSMYDSFGHPWGDLDTEVNSSLLSTQVARRKAMKHIILITLFLIATPLILLAYLALCLVWYPVAGLLRLAQRDVPYRMSTCSVPERRTDPRSLTLCSSSPNLPSERKRRSASRRSVRRVAPGRRPG